MKDHEHKLTGCSPIPLASELPERPRNPAAGRGTGGCHCDRLGPRDSFLCSNRGILATECQATLCPVSPMRNFTTLDGTPTSVAGKTRPSA